MEKHLAPQLRVALSSLIEGPFDLRINVDPAVLALDDDQFTFVPPVTGLVRYELVDHKVYSHGKVHSDVETPCARCLEPVRWAVEGAVEVLYENDPALLKPDAELVAGDDTAITYYNGETVWPGADLREALMIELPTAVLCSDACRGLCPHCGANLNRETCSCPKDDPTQGGWKSALRKIRLD